MLKVAVTFVMVLFGMLCIADSYVQDDVASACIASGLGYLSIFGTFMVLALTRRRPLRFPQTIEAVHWTSLSLGSYYVWMHDGDWGVVHPSEKPGKQFFVDGLSTIGVNNFNKEFEIVDSKEGRRAFLITDEERKRKLAVA